MENGGRTEENGFKPLDASCTRVFKGLGAHNSSRSQGERSRSLFSGDTPPANDQKHFQHDRVLQFLMTLTFDLTFSRKGGQSHCKWFRIPTISCFLYLNFLWYLKKTTFDVFSDLKCETFRLSEIWNNFQTDSDFLANASRFRNVRCFVTEGRMTCTPMLF